MQAFQRWKDGTTGLPLVDANMRELKETGAQRPAVLSVHAGNDVGTDLSARRLLSLI